MAETLKSTRVTPLGLLPSGLSCLGACAAVIPDEMVWHAERGQGQTVGREKQECRGSSRLWPCFRKERGQSVDWASRLEQPPYCADLLPCTSGHVTSSLYNL